VRNLLSSSEVSASAPDLSAAPPAGQETITGTRRVTVPASIDMVNVLGPRDEFLRVLERELEADIHVRGNEITLTGSPHALSLGV